MSEPEPEAGGGWTHQIGKYRFNADQSPAERDGNFGKVYSAVDSGTGTEVALKLALEQTDKITSAQLNEILCQEACHEHQFVVSIKDVVYDYVSPALSATSEGKKQLAVVTEKMGGGELFVEATKTMGMPEDVAKMYFRQILLAVAHVHGRGVAHRDMKLANLLLNDDKTVCKVCDFGLAKHVSDRAYASSVVGAGEYIAPEIIATETKQYDAIKADMWACGVVLYCMVECRFPFPKSKGLVMNSVASPENAEMVERLMAADYLPLKPGRSKEYVSFLGRLLSPNLDTRYSAKEALNDPWLASNEIDLATWRYLVDRELKSYEHSTGPVFPSNYADYAAWQREVERLVGEDVEEGAAEDDDGF